MTFPDVGDLFYRAILEEEVVSNDDGDADNVSIMPSDGSLICLIEHCSRMHDRLELRFQWST